MALVTLKVPGGFIRDCEEGGCDVGSYSDGKLTANEDQLAELVSRAKHYAYGGTDGSPIWLISAARALLRAMEKSK